MRAQILVECCFTSTETIGLLGTGAQQTATSTFTQLLRPVLKSRRMELVCGTACVKHCTFWFTMVSFLLAVYSPPGRPLEKKELCLVFHPLSLSRWSPHLPQCQSTASSSVSVTDRRHHWMSIVNGYRRHSQNSCSHLLPQGLNPNPQVNACLAVTCHLHFWQNDRDFLRATVVTRGWNGYRNKSQHRKSTLEKKILPPFQQGFEPATFQSRVRRSNHWAIPAPENTCVLLSVFCIMAGCHRQLRASLSGIFLKDVVTTSAWSSGLPVTDWI